MPEIKSIFRLLRTSVLEKLVRTAYNPVPYAKNE